jgi:hypothetical protein
MGSEAKERTELEVGYEVFRSQLRRVKSLPDMGPLACTVAFFADEESAMEFCKWLGELRNCVSAADEAFPNLVDHIAAAIQRAETAERERDEIKQRTTTAIDQFDKLAALIDAECKALGIEWHGTAETTLKAVLAKLRNATLDPLVECVLCGRNMWTGGHGVCGECHDDAVPIPLSGVGRIATERRRQIEREGYSAEHDDQYRRRELAQAAACYLTQSGQWPIGWNPDFDKRYQHSYERRLEIAGAFIAAELDRFERMIQRMGDAAKHDACG